ncbi:hypothetical protein JKP88DRAFT_326159 [Tribonema minus]|uniref:Uncharacterized protein n=1 Tax=Tribonema minus TaxID=303371 RepID=A0A836CD27_9STRA|nr:hypothetical protein JKP88DRAFT_326159 [Tribonema minus]
MSVVKVARSLARAGVGDSFLINWVGNVVVDRTIVVAAGACVEVHGTASDSVVDGGGKVQLFTIAEGATLVLEGLQLKNGLASDVGDSRAATLQGYGGAILAGPSAELQLSAVTLTGNAAALSGGAIFLAADAAARAQNCTFTANVANGPYNYDANKGDYGGGAVCLARGASLSVEASEFSFCAARTGSALRADTESSVELTATRVVNNTGIGAVEAVSGDGALWSRGNVRLTDVLFESNLHHFAGGIYYEAPPDVSPSGQRAGDKFNLKLLGTRVTFRGNAARFGGGMWAKANAPVELRASRFEGNVALETGAGAVNVVNETIITRRTTRQSGGAINAGDEAIITLINCVLQNNTAASQGGVMWVSEGTQLTILGGTIRGNSAVRGGAFSMKGPNDGHQHFHGVLIEENAASIEGGAMYIEAGVNGNATGCTFRGNAARAGGAIFSQEEQTFLVVGGTLRDNSARGAGGAVLQEGVNLTLAVSNETVFAENAAECCYINGYGSSEWWRARDNTCLDVDTAASRDCCLANFYTDGAQCIQCDPRLLNCTAAGTTNATLPLLPGMWRGALDMGQEIVRKCWNKGACAGAPSAAAAVDVTSTDAYCAPGYRGPYCAVCADGYTNFFRYTCKECSSGAAIALTVIAVVVVVGVVLIALVSFAVETDYESRGPGRSIRKVGNGGMRVLRALRIPVVVFQLIVQFVMITGAPLPDVYARFVAVLDFVNFDLSWLFSAGCVWDTSFYDRLLLATLVPLGIVAALIAARALAQRRRRRGAARRGGVRAAVHRLLVDKFWPLVLCFTFLIFSTTSTIVFQAREGLTFACDDVAGTGKSYLRADYAVECGTPQHYRYSLFSMLMIAVYPIGIPALYAVMLWRHRADFAARRARCRGGDGGGSSGLTAGLSVRYDSEQQQVAPAAEPRALRALAPAHLELSSTEFLWRPYRPEYYYWEVLECFRRLLLTGVLVFIRPGTPAQSAYACVFAYCSAVAYLRYAPHAGAADAAVYTGGASILFLSMFVALSIQADFAGTDTSGAAAVSALLIILNTLLVAASVTQAVSLAETFAGWGKGGGVAAKAGKGEPPVGEGGGAAKAGDGAKGDLPVGGGPSPNTPPYERQRSGKWWTAARWSSGRPLPQTGPVRRPTLSNVTTSHRQASWRLPTEVD